MDTIEILNKQLDVKDEQMRVLARQMSEKDKVIESLTEQLNSQLDFISVINKEKERIEKIVLNRFDEVVDIQSAIAKYLDKEFKKFKGIEGVIRQASYSSVQ